jgi:ankyrin repeat protein
MKYLMTYNESVRDTNGVGLLRSKMTPRREEDIKKILKNSLPNLELLDGAEYGFLWAVEDAIERGADITCDGHHGLAVAIQGGYLDIIKLLVSKDNLNQLSLNWALGNACKFGHTDVVKYLINRGANPKSVREHDLDSISDDKKDEIKSLLKKYGREHKTNESVRDKMTPKTDEEISNSLLGGLSEIYRKSKELNWNIDINGYGINAYLILNFKNCRITVIRDHRDNTMFANITRNINPQSTPYDIPDLSGYITNFDELKSKVDRLLSIPILRESVRDLMTPKSEEEIRVAQWKNIEARHDVYNYFDEKYDKERGIKNVYMDEIQRVADEFELSVDTVMKIVSEFKDLKINEGLKDKMTPKSEEDIRKKFAKMTPIQKIEKGAENGIMWAVEEGMRELKGKQSLNIAIQRAIQNLHTDIVEYLIDNGKMDLKDIDDVNNIIWWDMPTSYDEFKKSMIGKLDFMRLSILKKKKDYTSQLSYACQHNDYELAVEAIKNGADVKDKHGMFMWKAVSTGNEKLVRLLLESGVPSEQGTNSTAVGANQNVEKATGTNNIEMVKLLLQYGSKITVGPYSMLNHKIKEWVEKSLNHEMIVFLLEKYPSFNTVIEGEISKLDAKMKLYQKYAK